MGAVATPSAETINPPARHRGRWWVAALLFSAMAFNYFDRQMLAVLKPSLSTELKWSEMD